MQQKDQKRHPLREHMKMGNNIICIMQATSKPALANITPVTPPNVIKIKNQQRIHRSRHLNDTSSHSNNQLKIFIPVGTALSLLLL
jgi:hypothetical protein